MQTIIQEKCRITICYRLKDSRSSVEINLQRRHLADSGYASRLFAQLEHGEEEWKFLDLTAMNCKTGTNSDRNTKHIGTSNIVVESTQACTTEYPFIVAN